MWLCRIPVPQCDYYRLTRCLCLAFTSYVPCSWFLQLFPPSTLLTDLWLNLNLHEQMVKYSWLSEVFFIFSARKQYFTLLLHREKNIRKGRAWWNWTLLSFSIGIAHLWANSFQYCLTSNFEWLEWRRFSFLSFNLLFQFCKWDRYWLWRSSCREQRSFFRELRCPAAACPGSQETLSYFRLCCSDKHVC